MSLSIADLAELRQRLTSGFGPIESEVMAEKAASLGYHGRQVEKAMAALSRRTKKSAARINELIALLCDQLKEKWKREHTEFQRAPRKQSGSIQTRLNAAHEKRRSSRKLQVAMKGRER